MESGDDVARLDAAIRERRQDAPKETGPEPLKALCERMLASLPPPLTPEQQEAAQRRHDEATVRQAQAERSARLQSLFAERGDRYRQCTLENYQTSTPEQKTALGLLESYAADLERRCHEGEGIVLFGPAGTGKDHLLSALMRVAVLRFGKSVRWENGMDLFGDVRDRMDSDQTEASWVRSLCHPDILAISDPLPPFGPLTPFQANMLFRVIDGRYSRNKPTWVTLNCANREEAEHRMGAQMVDRLGHGALVIFTNWPSYRKGR